MRKVWIVEVRTSKRHAWKPALSNGDFGEVSAFLRKWEAENERVDVLDFIQSDSVLFRVTSYTPTEETR